MNQGCSPFADDIVPKCVMTVVPRPSYPDYLAEATRNLQIATFFLAIVLITKIITVVMIFGRRRPVSAPPGAKSV